jgi:hypothetical protein
VGEADLDTIDETIASSFEDCEIVMKLGPRDERFDCGERHGSGENVEEGWEGVREKLRAVVVNLER